MGGKKLEGEGEEEVEGCGLRVQARINRGGAAGRLPLPVAELVAAP